MAEYVRAGKVTYLGLSNVDAEQLRRASAIHPNSTFRTNYSVFALESDELFPVVDELGIGPGAYSTFARGVLRGAVQRRSAYAPDDIRHQLEWWSPEHYEQNVTAAGVCKTGRHACRRRSARDAGAGEWDQDD